MAAGDVDRHAKTGSPSGARRKQNDAESFCPLFFCRSTHSALPSRDLQGNWGCHYRQSNSNQGWNKVGTRFKQGSNKLQTSFKQASNKVKTPANKAKQG